MLKAKGLTFRIGEKVLLDGVSFEGTPGKLLAILGPNGAGKSTLIRLLSGALKAHAGSITWKDQVYPGNAKSLLARTRSVLTQKLHLSHPFSVEEVVMMGRYPHFKRYPQGNDKEIVRDWMKRTDTQRFGKRLYQSLSGGEQQRVQMARTLSQITGMEAPCLLLWDEPLNNLDIRYQHDCLGTARSMAQAGHVVMVVMHDLNMAAQYADQILLLKGGKRLSFGRTERVFTAENLAQCFDFPAYVSKHPNLNCLQVSFGNSFSAHPETQPTDDLPTLST
ncbi:MAG: heme ABC transporter ATP-binding protein [Bacteroidota bacterium]